MSRMQDANDQEPISSDGADTEDAATEATQVATGADAASSTAEGESAEKDTLSLVRDVVEESRPDAASASPAEGNENGQTTDDQASRKEPDDEGFSDVPFHKHPRFQQLLQQRDAYKDDATRYRNVQSFMDEHSLTAEETADGFMIMALLKTDPVAAWQRVKPIVQDLLIAAGEVLPDDLKSRVEAGEMTLEAATELSRTRALNQTHVTQRSFQQQQDERRRAQEHANGLQNAAVTWEQDRRQKDPNFEAKFPLIAREVTFLHATEGKPNTPDGVRDQLKRAYDNVNKAFRPAPVTPQRRQTPRPTSSNSAQGTAAPKPETTLDIIRRNRAKAG